jgi:hypothetical protein
LGKHLGDYAVGVTIHGKFSTFQPSTGAAFALAGTPALSVYKDASTTESTAGVTLTASFDSRTGLNHFSIDTSADGTFYSAGSNFDIVITTGTVDGVSVVGAAVASFTLARANVASLSAGAITATAIATDAIDADALADGAITAATFAANAITATVVADDTITAAKIAANAIGSAEIADGAITAAKIATDAIDADALAADACTEIATRTLTMQMTESYAANGAAPTLAQAVFALHQHAFDFSISGTSYTVEQLGGSTAFTITLNDDIAPTAAHRA